jgi:opacity protein-like surface antigen
MLPTKYFKEIFSMKRFCNSIVMSTLAVFFLFTVSLSLAAEAGPFYMGIFGGLIMPEDADMNWGDIAHDCRVSIDNGADLIIGLNAGYIIPQAKWLAVELEYNYQGEQGFDEKFVHRIRSVDVDGNLRSHNLMADFLLRYPQGRIHPYVGGGIGISFATAEVDRKSSRSRSVTLVDDNDIGFAWQLIAGVTFEITPNFSVDLAFKRFLSYCEYSSELSAIPWDLEVGSNNHIITAGINYYF